jgi:lipid-A-disaccharide synthase
MLSESELSQSRPGADLPPIFVSTGSTSSDVMVAPLLRELQRRRRVGEIAAVGGAPLRDLGARLFWDTTPASSVGIVAGYKSALRYTGCILRAYRDVDTYFRTVRPAMCILVDNPGQNLRLLSLAHQHQIPVLYYIPPEVWCLFRWQIRAIARKSTVIAAIFKSEGEAYRSIGGNVRWIGHPAIDLLSNVPRPHEMNGHPPTIGLFPGSRRDEVADLLPILKGAAELIRKSEPHARFVICSANETAARKINESVPTWNVPVEIIHRQSHSVLSRCDLLLTCSGTATLEAAVLGVPMVAMYRVHHMMDRVIQRLLARYAYFSLPNYLLNRQVIPEFRNAEANAERIAKEGLSLLRDTARRRQIAAGLAEVREMLGPEGAVLRAADLAEAVLDGRIHHEAPDLAAQQQSVATSHA